MKRLRFAAFGAGFWARFQLAGWRETGLTECVAIYNRTRAKAEALAREFGIPAVYDDAEELLAKERLDFIDVITDVETHSRFVHMAADRRLPVVCQKPLAPTLAEAERMAARCREAGVPLLVNENFRWQKPIRDFHGVLQSGVIGKPFRARIQFISGAPVFVNQPFLKDLEQFIITDVGSHTLDVARFLFGEADTLYCRNQRIHSDIRGEDIATIVLGMRTGTTVLVQMGYAENFLEEDSFPNTVIFVEGEKGSAELDPRCRIHVTTKDGTHITDHSAPLYPWADPAYDIFHASIVPCQANLAKALLGEERAETAVEDNIKTVRLVFACYDSARTGQVIDFTA